ncbi:hypothetical protein Q0O06_30300, partial [Bacillus thuringiensis]
EKKEEGWGKDTFGKDTFYYENGKKKTHSWVITEGNCYYLDNEGYKKTGWVNIKGYWFYFDKTKGILQKNKEITIGNDKVFLDKIGKIKTGWVRTALYDYYYKDGILTNQLFS